jgi:hypothetical protein
MQFAFGIILGLAIAAALLYGWVQLREHSDEV